ncbi:unnamed protein product, partial [Polarella glacialis]
VSQLEERLGAREASSAPASPGREVPGRDEAFSAVKELDSVLHQELRVLHDRCDLVQETLDVRALSALRQLAQRMADQDSKVEQLFTDGQDCCARVEEHEVRLGVARSKTDAQEQRLALLGDRVERASRPSERSDELGQLSARLDACEQRFSFASTGDEVASSALSLLGASSGTATEAFPMPSHRQIQDSLAAELERHCSKEVDELRAEFAVRASGLAHHAQVGFSDLRAHLGTVATQLGSLHDRVQFNEEQSYAARSAAALCEPVVETGSQGKEVLLRLEALEAGSSEQASFASSMQRSMVLLQAFLAEVKQAVQVAIEAKTSETAGSTALKGQPMPADQAEKDQTSRMLWCSLVRRMLAADAEDALVQLGEGTASKYDALAVAVERRLDELTLKVGSMPARMSVLEERTISAEALAQHVEDLSVELRRDMENLQATVAIGGSAESSRLAAAETASADLERRVAALGIRAVEELSSRVAALSSELSGRLERSEQSWQEQSSAARVQLPRLEAELKEIRSAQEALSQSLSQVPIANQQDVASTTALAAEAARAAQGVLLASRVEQLEQRLEDQRQQLEQLRQQRLLLPEARTTTETTTTSTTAAASSELVRGAEPRAPVVAELEQLAVSEEVVSELEVSAVSSELPQGRGRAEPRAPEFHAGREQKLEESHSTGRAQAEHEAPITRGGGPALPLVSAPLLADSAVHDIRSAASAGEEAAGGNAPRLDRASSSSSASASASASAAGSVTSTSGVGLGLGLGLSSAQSTAGAEAGGGGPAVQEASAGHMQGAGGPETSAGSPRLGDAEDGGGPAPYGSRPPPSSQAHASSSSSSFAAFAFPGEASSSHQWPPQQQAGFQSGFGLTSFPVAGDGDAGSGEVGETSAAWHGGAANWGSATSVAGAGDGAGGGNASAATAGNWGWGGGWGGDGAAGGSLSFEGDGAAGGWDMPEGDLGGGGGGGGAGGWGAVFTGGNFDGGGFGGGGNGDGGGGGTGGGGLAGGGASGDGGGGGGQGDVGGGNGGGAAGGCSGSAPWGWGGSSGWGATESPAGGVFASGGSNGQGRDSFSRGGSATGADNAGGLDVDDADDLDSAEHSDPASSECDVVGLLGGSDHSDSDADAGRQKLPVPALVSALLQWSWQLLQPQQRSRRDWLPAAVMLTAEAAASAAVKVERPTVMKKLTFQFWEKLRQVLPARLQLQLLVRFRFPRQQLPPPVAFRFLRQQLPPPVAFRFLTQQLYPPVVLMSTLAALAPLEGVMLRRQGWGSGRHQKLQCCRSLPRRQQPWESGQFWRAAAKQAAVMGKTMFKTVFRFTGCANPPGIDRTLHTETRGVHCRVDQHAAIVPFIQMANHAWRLPLALVPHRRPYAPGGQGPLSSRSGSSEEEVLEDIEEKEAGAEQSLGKNAGSSPSSSPSSSRGRRARHPYGDAPVGSTVRPEQGAGLDVGGGGSRSRSSGSARRARDLRTSPGRSVLQGTRGGQSRIEQNLVQAQGSPSLAGMGFGSLADVVEPLLRTGGGARPLNLELERAKMRSETRTCGGQGYVWSGDEEEELVEARDTEPCSDEAESEQEDRSKRQAAQVQELRTREEESEEEDFDDEDQESDAESLPRRTPASLADAMLPLVSGGNFSGPSRPPPVTQRQAMQHLTVADTDDDLEEIEDVLVAGSDSSSGDAKHSWRK